MISNKIKVRLVPFSGEFISKTFEWVSDPDLRKNFLMRGELTCEGHNEYFERILSDATQRLFAIYYEECHVGNCGLKNISISNKEGEFWIYIGEHSMRISGDVKQ
jgi:hypothetical protein